MWHEIFKKIAKRCKQPFTLKLDTTEVNFWPNEYQICEPGMIPTNFVIKEKGFNYGLN